MGASRRRRGGDERRKGILAAAAKVFERKGYDRATTCEIAAEAEVSEGTIYNYFASKRELLMSIVRESVPGLYSEALRLGNGEDVRSRLVSALEGMLTYVCTHRELLSVLVGEVWRNAEIMEEWVTIAGQDLLNRIVQRLDAAMKKGMLRPLDPAFAARTILFAGLGLALPIVRGTWPVPDESERRRMAEELADLLLHGLMAGTQPEAK